MADAFSIRRAGAADHEGVTRELAEYFVFLGEEIDAAGLDRDVADWQGAYDGVAGVMLVVVDPAGHVVGTAAVRRLEPGVVELKRMWLRPACRGRGIARRLMDRVLEEARGLGGRMLRLDSERRLEPAIRCIGAMGSRRSRTTTAIRWPKSGWSCGSHRGRSQPWVTRRSTS